MHLEIISINIDFVIYELKSALNFYVLYEINLKKLNNNNFSNFLRNSFNDIWFAQLYIVLNKYIFVSLIEIRFPNCMNNHPFKIKKWCEPKATVCKTLRFCPDYLLDL